MVGSISMNAFVTAYLLRYSLDRVLAVPLPIAIAFSIGALWRADRGGEERTTEGAPAG